VDENISGSPIKKLTENCINEGPRVIRSTLIENKNKHKNLYRTGTVYLMDCCNTWFFSL
jgi:hypothetical protein